MLLHQSIFTSSMARGLCLDVGLWEWLVKELGVMWSEKRSSIWRHGSSLFTFESDTYLDHNTSSCLLRFETVSPIGVEEVNVASVRGWRLLQSDGLDECGSSDRARGDGTEQAIEAIQQRPQPYFTPFTMRLAEVVLQIKCYPLTPLVSLNNT